MSMHVMGFSHWSTVPHFWDTGWFIYRRNKYSIVPPYYADKLHPVIRILGVSLYVITTLSVAIFFFITGRIVTKYASTSSPRDSMNLEEDEPNPTLKRVLLLSFDSID
jgi:hypothetical protein